MNNIADTFLLLAMLIYATGAIYFGRMVHRWIMTNLETYLDS